MTSRQIKVGIAVVAALTVVALFFIFMNPFFSSGLPGALLSQNAVSIEDEVAGTGIEVTVGSRVTVNYTGKLENGTKFDSSFDRNQPFSFRLGAGQAIEGWEKGILGMKKGGERKLIIPPQMAYGQAGIPNVIPPNATLIFEVELLEVK